MKITSGKRMRGHDVIGDIHGHADELDGLLSTLGYERRNGCHAHPEGRTVFFLGDYIDRGPKIREVLHTVRAMVEGGSALAILGNHEINALRFHTIGSSAGLFGLIRGITCANTRQRWISSPATGKNGGNG